MATMHLFSHNNQNDVQHNILGHVMPLILVPVSHDANSFINDTFYLLGQANKYKMQWEFLGHVMPLASASYDTTDPINGTTVFL